MENIWRIGEALKNVWRKQMLLDGINLLLGAGLAASAWGIGFVSEPAASWNAWLSGIAIAVLAAAGLLAFAEWKEWLILPIAVWVAASPWLVSFSGNKTAMWLHLMVGLIGGAVALAQIWRAHRHPSRGPRLTSALRSLHRVVSRP